MDKPQTTAYFVRRGNAALKMGIKEDDPNYEQYKFAIIEALKLRIGYSVLLYNKVAVPVIYNGESLTIDIAGSTGELGNATLGVVGDGWSFIERRNLNSVVFQPGEDGTISLYLLGDEAISIEWYLKDPELPF